MCPCKRINHILGRLEEKKVENQSVIVDCIDDKPIVLQSMETWKKSHYKEIEFPPKTEPSIDKLKTTQKMALNLIRSIKLLRLLLFLFLQSTMCDDHINGSAGRNGMHRFFVLRSAVHSY